MSNEEIKNRVREIVNKKARAIANEDKDFLLWLGNEFGVKRSGKSGCVKCWHDFAMQCWQKVAERESESELKSAETDRKYVLKAGVDLYFGNMRINNATITDELAEKIIARGFEKKWFVKCG